ncbi:unnamed protein product [Sphenostylis stenocarpa]|uniref:Neprosin PEP catalytic domain-containing protein n=1 Tax=Sphenostylis stenocarpa TaxID=92480 RepID=A0AA86T3E5_9FABA|nr:unnamed protein product [Sphenostylis stenocarpa]
MMKILFLVLCLVNRLHKVHGIEKDDLELETQLRVINKPPVKSIQTKFGYIVDCIDIYKQPAFDHPLLKDHRLRRKPSFQNSIEKNSVKNSSATPIIGLEKDQYCSTGTVPIRRTTKDDLIRSRSLFHNQTKLQGFPGAHNAEVYLRSFDGPYYKVSGQNSIYNPRVLRNDQTAISHIWVLNGPTYGTNKIAFGWHSDNYRKTGCYNMHCAGFVQTHRGNYLGARLDQTSVYGGIIVEFALSITQDSATKDWWLNVGGQNVGYFPAKLFSNLKSANQVGWGGRTLTPPGTPSPQMGSGYLPDGNFLHACYFRHISFQNATRKDFPPQQFQADTIVDKPDCFDAKYYGDLGGQVGYSLQFGGPGGRCGN